MLSPCRLLCIRFIVSRKWAQLTTSCCITRGRRNANLRRIGNDALVQYFIRDSFQEKEHDSPLLISRLVGVTVCVEIIVSATVEAAPEVFWNPTLLEGPESPDDIDKVGVRRY